MVLIKDIDFAQYPSLLLPNHAKMERKRISKKARALENRENERLDSSNEMRRLQSKRTEW